MLSIEMKLIISILEMTNDESDSHGTVNKSVKVPSQIAGKLLRKLQNEGLIKGQKGVIEADATQRLRLAVRAVDLGADLEAVSRLLRWQEFESMAAFALEQNGYDVSKNLRFKHGGRRWEIDIVGCRKPLVMCIDCKHWHRRLNPSELRKIVEKQIERTRAFAASLPNPTSRIECVRWNYVEFVPSVLSLLEGSSSFYDDVPIVPVLKLQDFLINLPVYAGSLRHFVRSPTTKLFNS
jgi:Holliday junction resolvase-like predicted endonuclease